MMPEEGQVLTGPQFSEPTRVETVRADRPGSWVLGVVGTKTERFRRVTLSEADLAQIRIQSATLAFDGDPNLLQLGLQAYALGIAFEFDPYFGLSISRVDPLPHQLEAVYDYLLKVAQVRFLAMLLQASGRTNALRALLAAEQERGSDFVRLSNALVAPYPQGSEERRLLEAISLALPRGSAPHPSRKVRPTPLSRW